MTIHTDTLDIIEAQAQLEELAEEVVRDGSEKILTKNATAHVALIPAKQLDYYHALEAEQGSLSALLEAHRALEDLITVRVMTPAELRARLIPGRPAND